MDHLKEGLSAWLWPADPLVEYKREAHQVFQDMIDLEGRKPFAALSHSDSARRTGAQLRKEQDEQPMFL